MYDDERLHLLSVFLFLCFPFACMLSYFLVFLPFVFDKAGEAYGVALAKYAEEHICTGKDENGEPIAIPARLWTSSLQRTQLTARHIKGKVSIMLGVFFRV